MPSPLRNAIKKKISVHFRFSMFLPFSYWFLNLETPVFVLEVLLVCSIRAFVLARNRTSRLLKARHRLIARSLSNL